MFFSEKYGVFCEDSFKTHKGNDGLCITDFLYKAEPSNILSPLVVNWGITGTCQNNCAYCYSDDYKESEILEDKSCIRKIIESIRALSPKVVVLSGGEPLMHPLFKWIVSCVQEFASVIIDTNGLLFNEEMVDFARQKHLHVRVSLDDYRGEINSLMRRSSIDKSTSIILNNIYALQDAEVGLTIHTVLSCLNEESIMEFGEFLLEKGFSNWRIQIIVPKSRFAESKNKDWLNRAISNITLFAERNRPKMLIRLANRVDIGRGLILVNPKGEFLIRDTGYLNKAFIDVRNPQSPSLEHVMATLDIPAHIDRYLGEFL